MPNKFLSRTFYLSFFLRGIPDLVLQFRAATRVPRDHGRVRVGEDSLGRKQRRSEQPLLRLAREQGQAYQKALDFMIHQQAVDGREVRAGDYFVAYAVEQAEGFYEAHGATLDYKRVDRSAEVNVHVEVVVRDGRDGRFVPNLEVRATLLDDKGQEIGTKDEPFMWHPWLFHYGENWRVPRDDKFTLRVAIDPPEFRRHDSVNGARYLQPVVVEFKDVHVKRGQK